MGSYYSANRGPLARGLLSNNDQIPLQSESVIKMKTVGKIFVVLVVMVSPQLPHIL